LFTIFVRLPPPRSFVDGSGSGGGWSRAPATSNDVGKSLDEGEYGKAVCQVK
jgi:hypothetical protein